MSIAFDPTKDAVNIAKHGVSLARAAELDVSARIVDARFDEPRYKAFGVLDGQAYCLAYTIRDGRVRAISLRRAYEGVQASCPVSSPKPKSR